MTETLARGHTAARDRRREQDSAVLRVLMYSVVFCRHRQLLVVGCSSVVGCPTAVVVVVLLVVVVVVAVVVVIFLLLLLFLFRLRPSDSDPPSTACPG